MNRELSIFTSPDALEFTEAVAYCHLENGWLADPFDEDEFEMVLYHQDRSIRILRSNPFSMIRKLTG